MQNINQGFPIIEEFYNFEMNKPWHASWEIVNKFLHDSQEMFNKFLHDSQEMVTKLLRVIR